jgi:hypothetical protein
MERGKASDRIAIVIGPDAEASVIYGLDKRTTESLARREYARLHAGPGGTPGLDK